MNLSAKIKSFAVLLLGFLFLVSCEELGSFGLAEDDIGPLEFFTKDLNATGGLVLIELYHIQRNWNNYGRRKIRFFWSNERKSYSAFFLSVKWSAKTKDDAILDSVKLNMNFNYKSLKIQALIKEFLWRLIKS